MVVKTYEGYYVHIALVFYNLGATFSDAEFYWWYDTDFISPIIHNSKQKYVDPIKIIKMREGLELSWHPFPGYINLCLYNPNGIKLKSYEVCAQSGKKFLDYGKMSLSHGIYFLRVKPSNIVFPIIICK